MTYLLGDKIQSLYFEWHLEGKPGSVSDGRLTLVFLLSTSVKSDLA